MKNLFYIGGLALLAITSCGRHDSRVAHNFNEKTDVDDKSLAFVKAVAEANSAEVKVATLAEAKSKNPRVINFAKMMVKDHTEAGKDLKNLAFKNYVTLADSPSLEHKQLLDSLNKINAPADFDKAYMKAMVAGHEKVVQLFYDESETNNVAMKKYAKKYLPAVKMHLDSAKEIFSSLK